MSNQKKPHDVKRRSGILPMLLAWLFSVLFLAGCGGSESPKDVVTSFISACEHHNYAKAAKYVYLVGKGEYASEDWEVLRRIGGETKRGDLWNYKLGISFYCNERYSASPREPIMNLINPNQCEVYVFAERRSSDNENDVQEDWRDTQGKCIYSKAEKKWKMEIIGGKWRITDVQTVSEDYTEYEIEEFQKKSAERKAKKTISFSSEKELLESLDLVLVGKGTFKRGNNTKVTISKDFWLGKYEVTQAEWRQVMGDNPSEFKGDSLPVENVSWDDAMKYCEKLNEKTEGSRPKGYRFSLPTEAQWEYAARGGSQSQGYEYSGSNDCGEVAWYEDNSGRKTHAVGTKKPNELGLYDMSGNVWEWCRDRYGDYPDKDVTDPAGPESGSSRVNRGGSWILNARDCRVALRYYLVPSFSYVLLGFRLALVPVQ